MPNLNYALAVIHTLSYVRGNSKGERIVDVEVSGFRCTLFNHAHELQYIDQDDQTAGLKEFSELPEDLQYDILAQLDANKYNLESKENMIELPSWEDMNWKAEPVEIKGQDGQVIGRIGTGIVQKKAEGDLLAVIFIAGDNTWATLTMYQDKDKDSWKTAADDLARIGTVINCLSTTL